MAVVTFAPDRRSRFSGRLVAGFDAAGGGPGGGGPGGGGDPATLAGRITNLPARVTPPTFVESASGVSITNASNSLTFAGGSTSIGDAVVFMGTKEDTVGETSTANGMSHPDVGTVYEVAGEDATAGGNRFSTQASYISSWSGGSSDMSWLWSGTTGNDVCGMTSASFLGSSVNGDPVLLALEHVGAVLSGGHVDYSTTGVVVDAVTPKVTLPAFDVPAGYTFVVFFARNRSLFAPAASNLNLGTEREAFGTSSGQDISVWVQTVDGADTNDPREHIHHDHEFFDNEGGSWSLWAVPGT